MIDYQIKKKSTESQEIQNRYFSYFGYFPDYVVGHYMYNQQTKSVVAMIKKELENENQDTIEEVPEDLENTEVI